MTSDCALVFSTERFALHDGPGIRTQVFLKGCPLRCSWCCNPESQLKRAELSHEDGRCIGCGACAAVCPEHAIAVIARADASPCADVNRSACTGCGQCVPVCKPRALSLIGHSVSQEELLAELLRDEVYYRRSGGGVTVTGGEPLSQSPFVAELGRRLAALGIDMLIDSSGFGPWSAIEMLLPYTKAFLYDIKHVDPEKHRLATGEDNQLILENCRRLSERNVPLTVRIPLVPGLNSEDEDLRSIVGFLHTISSLHLVEIVPYHELGVPKYRRLGKAYRKPEGTLDAERVRAVIAYFGKNGLRCRRAF